MTHHYSWDGPLDNRAELIVCPACSALIDEDELCAHRNPICLSCCMSGEHDWPPGDVA